MLLHKHKVDISNFRAEPLGDPVTYLSVKIAVHFVLNVPNSLKILYSKNTNLYVVLQISFSKSRHFCEARFISESF